MGLVLAVLTPGFFRLGNAPAESPGQALTALLVLLVVGMVVNVTVAAAGSGVWLMVRGLVWRGRPVAADRG